MRDFQKQYGVRIIPRNDGSSFEKYINDIKGFEVLTSEEEVALIIKAQSGDKESLDKVVKANLLFVVSVAKKYQGNGVPLNELVNEGNIGLIIAVMKHDVTKGFKLISYAVWWIKQRIIECLEKHSKLIRLPVAIKSSISESRGAFANKNSFFQENEREMSIDELAEIMNVSNKKATSYLNLYKGAVSLDANVFNTDDITYAETIQNPDNDLLRVDADMASENNTHIVNSLLSTLTDRDRKIVEMYYGINSDHSYDHDSIAEEFGLTRERVRQICNKSVKNLAVYIDKIKKII